MVSLDSVIRANWILVPCISGSGEPENPVSFALKWSRLDFEFSSTPADLGIHLRSRKCFGVM